MTDTALDPFESIRSALLDATTRDVTRHRRRTRGVTFMLAALVTLFVATGLATAANDNFARTVHALPGGSVFDVFHGADKHIPVPPSSQASLDQMNDINQHGSTEVQGTQRVLLHRRIRGVLVTIVAVKQRHSETATGRDGICYSVTTDDPGAMSGGVICTPDMMPGLPVNYGTAINERRGHVTQLTVAGVTDDTVSSIQMVTQAGIEDVVLGNHAFWWRARPGHLPKYLHIHKKNGTTVDTADGFMGAGGPLRSAAAARKLIGL